MSRILNRLSQLTKRKKEPENPLVKQMLAEKRKSQQKKPGPPKLLKSAFIFVLVITTVTLSFLYVYKSFVITSEQTKTPVADKVISPVDLGQSQNQSAINAFKSGANDQALRHWQKLVIKYPKQSDYYVNLAMSEKQRGQLDRAKRLLAKAIELAPTNSVAHNNLGVVALELGDDEFAERSFKQAVKHDTDFVTPILNLAIWHEKNKRFDSAIDLYSQAASHSKIDKNLAVKLRKRLPRLYSLYAHHRQKGAQ